MSFLRLKAGTVFASLAAILACAADELPRREPQAATPLAAQPLENLSATRERPLFSPTRRPPPPPPAIVQGPPPPPPPPPPPDVVLFGVVMDGERARAIIRAGPADKATRVGIGDDVGGWKVVQIEGRRLVLSLDGRMATFVMFTGKSANGAPTDSALQTLDKKPQDSTQQGSPPNPESSGAARPHRVRRPN